MHHQIYSGDKKSKIRKAPVPFYPEGVIACHFWWCIFFTPLEYARIAKLRRGTGYVQRVTGLPTVISPLSPSPKVIGDAPVTLYPYAPVPLLPQRGTGYVSRQRRRGKGVLGASPITFGEGERGIGNGD